jgi:hypothetical protein
MPGWQDVNPVITLYTDRGNFIQLKPKKDQLASPPYIEAREGWTYLAVPLAGSELWAREVKGKPGAVNYFTIGVDSWGGDPLQVWIDGLAIK